MYLALNYEDNRTSYIMIMNSIQHLKKALALTIFALLILPCNILAQSGVANELDEMQLPVSQLASFSRLRVEANMELTLVEAKEGDSPRIVYDLGDNDPEKFKFSVKGDKTLSITQIYNSRSVSVIRAKLYYNKELNNITISRAKVYFGSNFKGSLIDIALYDEAEMRCTVDCDDMKLEVQSDSRMTLEGRSRYLSLDASSGARVELRSADILSMIVRSSHGAVVALNAGERLQVNASTGSTVKYWGTPLVLRVDKSLISGSLLHQE